MIRRRTSLIMTLLFAFAGMIRASVYADPVDIGSRRELFVDDYLVERLTGNARLVVQEPVPQEVVLVTDKPWEGSSCLYFTIFQDGDLYRMYYRGLQIKDGKPAHREVVCYAESRDGVEE